MEIQLNRKILFRKSIRQAYKQMFGRKPTLDYENKLLAEMIRQDNSIVDDVVSDAIINGQSFYTVNEDSIESHDLNKVFKDEEENKEITTKA